MIPNLGTKIKVDNVERHINAILLNKKVPKTHIDYCYVGIGEHLYNYFLLKLGFKIEKNDL